MYRYNILYVIQCSQDTGGLLYPTALNQLFGGIYVMELCMIGLFLLIRGPSQSWPCIAQAIIMVIATALTLGYQLLLNRVLGPLLVFMPTVRQVREDGLAVHQSQGLADEDRVHADHNSQDHEPFESTACFKHASLVNKPPTVHVPKDCVGYSDSEMRRLRGEDGEINISDDGATMDMKGNLELHSHFRLEA